MSRPDALPPLFTRLPRPRPLRVKGSPVRARPQRDDEVFKAGIFRTTLRLVVWMGVAMRFALGILADKLRRRDTDEHRAKRLCAAFKKAGTTFIKLGQQLSIRLDLLPYAYVIELEKMLDEAPPIAIKDAISAIERSSGKKMAELFSRFDPEPIGSGSIACVYQAHLLDGQRVAVKVRRPDIGRLLSEDMRALGWLLALAEAIVLSPGFSGQFLYELSTMLMEELNFKREARYTDLFRRRARKVGIDYLHTPRIHFELSNREVMISEFVTGVWLKDLIRAVEHGDVRALARLARRGIFPKLVARRILVAARFGGQESLVFHADLHPANILVLPESEITLIDFGSCGVFTEKDRRIWREIADANNREDIGRMVQAALALIEPLPHVDMDEFTKKLEPIFWQDLYANKSKDAAWWERTSANLWIGFFSLAREYDIPMSLNTLKMIRSSMLCDSLAARLYPKIDHYAEYRRYERDLGARAKKRLVKKLGELGDDRSWIRAEQVFDTAMSSVYRVQRFLDATTFTFASLERAVNFAIKEVLWLGFKLLLGAVAAVAISVAFRTTGLLEEPGSNGQIWATLKEVIHAEGVLKHGLLNPWYVGFATLVLLVTTRRILYRLGEKDVSARDL